MQPTWIERKYVRLKKKLDEVIHFVKDVFTALKDRGEEVEAQKQQRKESE
jgi:hypothetical protein